jgi:hypothetical protein
LNLRPLGYEQNNARLVSLARYPLTSQNAPRASPPVAHVRGPSGAACSFAAGDTILTGTPKSGGWDGPTMICVEPGPAGR